MKRLNSSYSSKDKMDVNRFLDDILEGETIGMVYSPASKYVNSVIYYIIDVEVNKPSYFIREA